MLDENAKAVQEISKATGKGIDLLSEIGSVISRPVKEGMGIIYDNISYKRWKNQLKLDEMAQQEIKKYESKYKRKPIEFKLAVPFLDAATLEDDDFMRKLWVNLLINSSYEESGVELNRIYIDVLERLTYLDAKNLLSIFSLPFEDSKQGVITYDLPSKAVLISESEYNENDDKIYSLSEENLFSLGNLERLGCISAQNTYSPYKDFSLVTPTMLGKKLVESYTLNFSKLKNLDDID